MRYVLPLIFGVLGLHIPLNAGNVASVGVSLRCLSDGSTTHTASNSGVDYASAYLGGCDGSPTGFPPGVSAVAETGFWSSLRFNSDTGGAFESLASLTGWGEVTSEYMLTLPSDSLVFVYADFYVEHRLHGDIERSIHFAASTPWDLQVIPDPILGSWDPPLRVEFAAFHTPVGPSQMYPISFTAWSMGYGGLSHDMSSESGTILVVEAGYTLPEPSSGLLIGFGLTIVAGLRIWQRKKA